MVQSYLLMHESGDVETVDAWGDEFELGVLDGVLEVFRWKDGGFERYVLDGQWERV